MRCLLLILIGSLGAIAAPRLLIDPDKVAELRRLVAIKGSAHEEMLTRLRQKVDSGEAVREPTASRYSQAYQANMAAFLAQVTGETRYCEVAYSALRAVYEGVTPESILPEQGYGLARATVGAGFAYAYDWCRDFWNPEQSRWVAQKLRAGLDAWLTFQHANVEAQHKGSNWVAVCRGGELIELLALRLEQERASRYALLKRDLLQHMRNYDDLGVSQEGIGYTAYGGIFLLRALLALRSVGDPELEAEAARHGWWKQAMYSGTFVDQGGGRTWLMSGVSHAGIGDEGWASLLFAFTPAEQKPFFKWWYDRHLGHLSPGPAARRFDPRREGPVWAMIYYPAHIPAQDPTGVYPAAVAGSGGLVLFRNRWQDSDDLILSFHADTQWHSHAWDQPEALHLNLFAYGASFAGGPEKTRDPANFSTLLVDGQHVGEKARGTTGKLISFMPSPTGGTAVAGGGTQYSSLGVQAERTLTVEFLAGNRARLSLRDRVQSPNPRRFSWQLNLGNHASNGGIRPTGDFTLAAPRGRLRGTVLAPTGTRVEPGDPFRVETNAASLDLQIELQLEPLPAAPNSARSTVLLPGAVPMEFVPIPPGTYRRGSPDTETSRDPDEGPQHEVTISRGFQLGVFEVTQRQWQAVLGENPATFQQTPSAPVPPGNPLDRPVESVSWDDTQRFLNRLNRLGLGRFRLPTEAEWEYAARGGASTAFPWGNTGGRDRTHEFAWANSRSFATTHPVGQKPPNAWGLHDMHGNVWEWCADWYGPYAASPQTDPVGPPNGKDRVFRGGSWYDFPNALRSANRHRHPPDGRYPAIGLRLVKEIESENARTIILPSSVPLQLVRIPAGRFLMGSPNSEIGRANDESPLHEVTISQPFWLAAYEVSQQQWSAVMGGNPSTFIQGEEAPRRPVERVSWNDAQQFLSRLNALGIGRFRLPTEAEWEYAARAGSPARFAFGDDPAFEALGRHAWFYSRAEGRSHPVGAKQPNSWGVYDLYGNVWEWCADWFGPYSADAATDPQGPASGRERVIRGGSWFNEPEALRSANRHRHPPDSRQTNLGLRLIWSEK
ncbi:MAG: formylglycine-generating enzyme family protein [Bryobacter sp.]|jgi:formylglycine-generating enzyme required for sulfatase activity|nr:formylglycine-generating enzyme family protein [Bryobacter sp. CoA8 C33]